MVVNGTLRGAERDVFRVYGKGGERRVFEVEARRCGSAVDPVLRILDGTGKQLARSDDSAGAGLDARLDFTFPAEGNYYVEVTDARFSNQAQNFYRLKMGTYRYAEGIFPLGGRRGEKAPVTFFGARLGAGVAVHGGSGEGRTRVFTRVSLPDSPALPFLFAVSDLPEVMEPVQGAIPLPGVVNGRLDKDRRDRPLPPAGGARETAAAGIAGARAGHIEAGRHHHGVRCRRARSSDRPATSRCPRMCSRFRAPAAPAAIHS